MSSKGQFIVVKLAAAMRSDADPAVSDGDEYHFEH